MLQKEGEVRIPSGCAISGLISKKGRMICGDTIVNSMSVMHERSNGLGGGFAGYGIYPQYKDLYALHIFYDNMRCRETCERYLDEVFEVVSLSVSRYGKRRRCTERAAHLALFCDAEPQQAHGQSARRKGIHRPRPS